MSSQPDESRSDSTLTCPRCNFRFPSEPTPPSPPADPGELPLAGGTVSLEAPPELLPQQLPAADRPSTGTVSLPPELSPGPATPATPLPDGSKQPTTVGRFAIQEFVGEGAFGLVYRAYDPSLKREVALKVARPEQMHSRQRIERFQREARAAAHLMHPHIVAIFDHGQDGPNHYIASAFIKGQSLARVLEALPEGQTLPLPQAVEIVRKLAEALAYAHREKVIHRDIKPGNVMLRHDGEPLLMDFGLAARAEGEEKLTQAGMVLGTPEYMAPEQWQNQAEPASDQYSLGCLLFELLTGKKPFSGGTPGHYLFLHTHQAAPSPRKLNGQVPRDLETVCLKCLEKEPAKRYADCGALAEDLARFQAGLPVQARPVGKLERTWRWCRRNPVVAFLVAVVLVLLVAVTGVSTYSAFRLNAELTRTQKAEQQAQADNRLARLREAEALVGQTHGICDSRRSGQATIATSPGCTEGSRG